jgi:uncharacterized membrane protein YhhN
VTAQAQAASPPASRGGVLLGLFCALAALHLVAVTADYDLVRSLSKPLLMPLLALWARALGAPRLLVAALLCGCGGDLLLDIGGPAFLAGMACFAAGHVCYLRLFSHAGSFRAPTPTAVRLRCAAYAAVWATLVILLWPGLDPAMRVPVALYSVLLAAMAAGAYGVSATVALGGALFLLSDSLIATDLADWPQLPAHDVWVMTTYLAAQTLLTSGLLRTRAPAGAG